MHRQRCHPCRPAWCAGAVLGAPPCRWTGRGPGRGWGSAAAAPAPCPPSGRRVCRANGLLPATPCWQTARPVCPASGSQVRREQAAGAPGGLSSPHGNCLSQDSGSGATSLNPGVRQARSVRHGPGPRRSVGGRGYRRRGCWSPQSSAQDVTQNTAGDSDPAGLAAVSAQCPGDPPHPLLAGRAACTSHWALVPAAPAPRCFQLRCWGLAESRGRGGVLRCSSLSWPPAAVQGVQRLPPCASGDLPLRASPDPGARTGAQPRPAPGTHEIRTMVSCLGEATNVGVTAQCPGHPDLRPEWHSAPHCLPAVPALGLCTCWAWQQGWPGQASARGALAREQAAGRAPPLVQRHPAPTFISALGVPNTPLPVHTGVLASRLPSAQVTRSQLLLAEEPGRYSTCSAPRLPPPRGAPGSEPCARSCWGWAAGHSVLPDALAKTWEPSRCWPRRHTRPPSVQAGLWGPVTCLPRGGSGKQGEAPAHGPLCVVTPSLLGQLSSRMEPSEWALVGPGREALGVGTLPSVHLENRPALCGVE